MTYSIWWVDDEPYFLRAYARTIEEHPDLELTQISEVDEAVQMLQTLPAPSLLMWDMIMPPGEEFKDQPTDAGLSTGRLLFHVARSKFPVLPAVLFTNVKAKWADDFDHPNEMTWVLEKVRYTPEKLVEKLLEILQTNPNQAPLAGSEAP